jgi:hypothetical protein
MIWDGKDSEFYSRSNLFSVFNLLRFFIPLVSLSLLTKKSMLNELIYIGFILNLSTYLKPLLSMSAENVTLKDIGNKESYFSSLISHFYHHRFEILLVFILSLLGYRFLTGYWLDLNSLVLIVLYAITNIFVGLIIPLLIIKENLMLFLLATIAPQILALVFLLLTWNDSFYLLTLILGNLLFLFVFYYREVKSFQFEISSSPHKVLLGNSTRIFTIIAMFAFLVRSLTRQNINSVNDEWLLRIYDLSLLTYTTIIIPLVINEKLSLKINMFIHLFHIIGIPIVVLFVSSQIGVELSSFNVLLMCFSNMIRFELFRVSFEAVRKGIFIHSILIDSLFQLISLIFLMMDFFFIEAYLIASIFSCVVYVGYYRKF